MPFCNGLYLNMQRPLQFIRLISSSLILSGVLVFQLSAQNKKNENEAKQTEPTAEKKDDKNDFPSYDKIITSKAKTDKGLFTVHKIDDKYFLELPDSLLGREILVVTRISK